MQSKSISDCKRNLVQSIEEKSSILSKDMYAAFIHAYLNRSLKKDKTVV